MFVADAIIWVGGLILVGIIGFFVMAVVLVFRFLGWLFRAMTGRLGACDQGNPLPTSPRRLMVCPHPGCGHTNGPTALYCGRCGRPLRRTYDVDGYG